MSGREKMCVMCGRPAGGRYRAFCSQRCADKDLAQWFGGVYRVETETPPSGDDEFDESGTD